VAAVDACPTGLKDVGSLYSWPGTVEGCLVGLEVTKGACVTGTGTSIPLTSSVDLSVWKGGKFCAKVAEKTDY